MAERNKKLLIVDDSEIDRTILKSILSDDFTIMELDNGYEAMNWIQKMGNELDAILLDISMPLISGFEVLKFMKQNQLDNIPVFLISADATEENVEEAAKYNIAEFICKPFDKDDVLRRLRSWMGVLTDINLTKEDLPETNHYISSLETVYKIYLANFDRNDAHYETMYSLMLILLDRYRATAPEADLNKDKIEVISKAAYFCDIGHMLIPDKLSLISRENEKPELAQQNHTILGSNIIQLNTSKHCEYFVQICSDMCIHHHERYDGRGYPHRISGRNNSIYNQLCRLVDELDSLLSKFYGSNEMQVNFVIKRLLKEDGMVGPEVLSLLEDCKPIISKYYVKNDRQAQ